MYLFGRTGSVFSQLLKICIYSTSAGANFFWQAVIAIASSSRLSAIEASSFLFYYSTLSALSFWDFGFSLSQASALNVYLRGRRDKEGEFNNSIVHAADYFKRYFISQLPKVFLICSAFSVALISVSFLRSHVISLTQISTCFILGFAYAFKVPADSMILLYEVRHDPQYGKLIQGGCQLLGSIIVSIQIYFHIVSAPTIAIVFLYANIVTFLASSYLLKLNFKDGIVTNQENVSNIMQSIHKNRNARLSFFLPGFLSYASTFLTLPISYMLVSPSQIPILNNLLFLVRTLGLPSTIVVGVYRAQYVSLDEEKQKIKFIKILTVVCTAVTIIAFTTIFSLMLLTQRGFIRDNVLLSIFANLPLSWILIASVNVCIVSMVSPFIQSLYFSGSANVSKMMIINIFFDLLFSLLFGYIIGVTGILGGTLLAGMLTTYWFAFHSLWRIFRTEKWA